MRNHHVRAFVCLCWLMPFPLFSLQEELPPELLRSLDVLALGWHRRNFS